MGFVADKKAAWRSKGDDRFEWTQKFKMPDDSDESTTPMTAMWDDGFEAALIDFTVFDFRLMQQNAADPTRFQPRPSRKRLRGKSDASASATSADVAEQPGFKTK